nr:hypothetical protein Itr_chr13CG04010 [Ipomoea trifida]GMD73916.1 hypothetical protein Iba_chr13aCG0320 [Ipomoea batatas]GMD76605.1 hypothetical protein Iba_chr13bCG11800 [Ipomoea batatas]GMD80614.1 hypothetical protein Iba_chr13eCG3600 [Ipomoea batatas]
MAIIVFLVDRKEKVPTTVDGGHGFHVMMNSMEIRDS